MTIQVEIKGVDNLVSKLRKLGKLETVTAYLLAAAEYLKDKFDKAPAIPHLTRKEVYGSAFKSVNQRMFFFASLADGSIEVPYHRGESGKSERLEQSWTVKSSDEGLKVTIGNDTPYGLFVQGDDQSLFMQKVGWIKVSDTVDAEKDHVVDKIKDGLEKEIINISEGA